VKVAPNGCPCVSRAGRSRDHAGRHLYTGIARLGGNRRPGRTGKQNGVQLVGVHVGVDPQRARGAQIHLPRRNIFDGIEAAFGGLRGEKDVLAEA